MTDHLAKLAGISWSHFVRWFVLGRVFGLATQVRSLFLGTSGALLTIFGWWLLTVIFAGLDNADVKDFAADFKSCPWTEQERTLFPQSLWDPLEFTPDPMGHRPDNAMLEPWARLSSPYLRLFALPRTFTGTLFLLLAIVWSAAVWAFFGGAITRGAMWQLTREEPASTGAVTRYAKKRWLAYFTAPLLPLGGVLLVTAALSLLGLLMRGSILFAGIGWPLALIGGIAMTILMLGLLFGWPLMHATISAEGSDGFDALSRSYSYVSQRPMHYGFYLLAASILGSLGLVVVMMFAAFVETLTTWAVSWGSGSELMLLSYYGLPVDSESLSAHDRWGIELLGFWKGCVRLIVIGYAFSFFWTSISAIYLLLRHDADGKEISEIHEEESPESFGLPPLMKDAAGVPTAPIAESPAKRPSSSTETPPPPGSPSDPSAPPSAS